MQALLMVEQEIRTVITSSEMLYMSRRLQSMERDYGSGKSFIRYPVAIHFSAVIR